MGTRVEVVKDLAAQEILMRRYNLTDWQARRVLCAVRVCAIDEIPVDGGFSTLSIQYKDGHYHIGGYRRGARYRFRANAGTPDANAGTPDANAGTPE